MATRNVQLSGARAEREILIWFFTHIGGSSQLVAKGKLITSGDASGLYQSALAILRGRLANGWTLVDIRQQLLTTKDMKVHTVKLQDVLPAYPEDFDGRNLLMNARETYTHPALFDTVLPKMHLNLQTGVAEVVAAGSITPRVTFTLKDLVAYYVQELKPPTFIRANVESALSWMLQHEHPVDVILFAIDFWVAADRSATRGAAPFGLTQYLPAAGAERSWRLEGQGKQA